MGFGGRRPPMSIPKGEVISPSGCLKAYRHLQLVETCEL